MHEWHKSLECERKRRGVRGPRVEWSHLANLIDDRGTHIPIIVENVSQSGVLIQCEEVLCRQASYQLVTRSDRQVIKVEWIKGCFAGSSFAQASQAAA